MLMAKRRVLVAKRLVPTRTRRVLMATRPGVKSMTRDDAAGGPQASARESIRRVRRGQDHQPQPRLQRSSTSTAALSPRRSPLAGSPAPSQKAVVRRDRGARGLTSGRWDPRLGSIPHEAGRGVLTRLAALVRAVQGRRDRRLWHSPGRERASPSRAELEAMLVLRCWFWRRPRRAETATRSFAHSHELRSFVPSAHHPRG
jgi:hypothetical protein